jgi:hypothetical protein
MAGKGLAARAGLLAPLALLTLLVASALVVIASIILDHIIDNDTSGQGSGFNRVSPTLQWFMILACAFAFAAAWLTFWHTKTYRASTRYVSGGLSWLALFISAIPTGLAIKAIIIGGLDALNWVAIILTWVLTGLLLLLALILHTPLNKEEPQHYHHHRSHTTTETLPVTDGKAGLPYNSSPAGAVGYGGARNVDRVV